MKKTKFFLIILYDNDKKVFDIIQTSNDELLTNNVAMLQREEFGVHCNTAELNSISMDEENLNNYNREKGLYNRLLNNYEKKTGITPKRW